MSSGHTQQENEMNAQKWLKQMGPRPRTCCRAVR
ncbi:hypothetical protein OKW27_000801 [Paraburkholderia sp. 35.1]